jgi:hypothetical protein
VTKEKEVQKFMLKSAEENANSSRNVRRTRSLSIIQRKRLPNYLFIPLLSGWAGSWRTGPFFMRPLKNHFSLRDFWTFSEISFI